jgi:hypothetical protein
MPYSFNPFTGNFDNTPSTLKGDSAYSNVLSNSADWTDAYDTGTVYKANSASYATIDFTNDKFFPLSGGIITGNTRINGNVTIFGDLTSTGTQTFANTVFTTTSSLSIVHVGVGPAFWVGNNGSGDIASFNDIDQGIEVLHIGGTNGDFPNVGVKTSAPNKDFTVNGEISASNTIWDANGNSSQWNSVYSSYNTASSNIATNSYVASNFLPLSGGDLTGKLTVAATTTSSKLNIGNGLTTTTPTSVINGDVWISSGNRLSYRSSGTNYSTALTNISNSFNSNQIIDASHDTNPVLRVTQRGAGLALLIEDQANPDSNPFIIDNLGSVGIGLSSLSGIDAKLTVVGNISSTGLLFVSGGNSDQWNSAYSTVQSNSATNWNYQGTDLKDLSSGWVDGNNAFTNLVANSAAYLSAVDLSFLSVSADWNSVYNTVQTNSAVNWNYQGTDLKNLSANWQNTYSNFSSNSASYATQGYVGSNFYPLTGGTVGGSVSATGDGSFSNLYISSELSGDAVLYASDFKVGINTEVPNEALTVKGNISASGQLFVPEFVNLKTVVQSNSADWSISIDTGVRALTSSWTGGNEAFTNLVANSAAYLSSVDLSFLSVSADWNSVYNTVQTNSATGWNYQGTDIKSLTSDWQTAYEYATAYSSTSGSVVTYETGDVIKPRGAIVGSSSDSNSIDVSQTVLDIRSIVHGVQVTTSPDQINFYTWNFNPNGSLTYPDNTSQTTAFTGIPSYVESTYSTVQSNSASWDYQGTDLKNLSANWQNTYSDFSSNSASFATNNFVQSNFLPLSGGTVSGAFEVNDGSISLFVSANKVGINTEVPNKSLTVVGDISSTGTIYTNYLELSDVKFTNEYTTNANSVTARNDFLKVFVGNNVKYLRLYDIE